MPRAPDAATSHWDDVAIDMTDLFNGRLLLTLDDPLNPLVAARNALPAGTLNRGGSKRRWIGLDLGPVKQRKPFKVVGDRDLARIDALAPKERTVVWHGFCRVPHHGRRSSIPQPMTLVVAEERDASLPERAPSDPERRCSPRQQSDLTVLHGASLTNAERGPGAAQ